MKLCLWTLVLLNALSFYSKDYSKYTTSDYRCVKFKIKPSITQNKKPNFEVYTKLSHERF